MRTRGLALPLWCALAHATIGAAGSFAHAQQPPVALAVKGCKGMDRAALLRLLLIELSAVESAEVAIKAPTIDVYCQGDWVRLTLVDRDSGGYLDRMIPAPAADDPGRERVVALAASQLVLAWLPRPAPPQPAPAATRQTRRRSKRARAAPGPRGSLSIGLRGGARFGDLVDRAVPMVALGALVGYAALPRFQWLFFGEFSHGAAERELGSVSIDFVSFGGGAGFVAWRDQPLRVELDALIGLRYASLDGEPSADARQMRDTVGRAKNGFGLDFGVAGGPVWQTEPLAFGLKLRAGAITGGPLGRVSSGPPVARAGPWLGLALEVAGVVWD